LFYTRTIRNLDLRP